MFQSTRRSSSRLRGKLAVSILALVSLIGSTQSAYAALTIGALTVTSDGALILTSTSAATTITSGAALTMNSAATSDTTLAGTATTGNIAVGGALTSGGVTIGNASSTTGIATIQSGATTTNAVNVTANAVTTANAVDISANALTEGTALDIGGLAAITTGKGINVTTGVGTTQTTGILTNISSAATAITGAGRLLYSNHTGTTGASATLNEFASNASDETIIAKVTASGALAAGKALDITSASTTGNALAITSTATSTGDIFNITNSSIGTTTADMIHGGHTATYTTSKTIDDGNLLDLSRSITASGAATTVTLSAPAVAISSNCPTAASGTCTDTGNVLSLTQSNVSSTGNGLAITSAAVTGKGASITMSGVQTGIGSALEIIADSATTAGAAVGEGVVKVSADGLTTGTALDVTSTSAALAAGEMLNVEHIASSATLTAKTGQLVDITTFRTNSATGGTVADDYDALSIFRTSKNTAAGTFTAAGAGLYVENVVMPDSGTLTDTAKGLEVVMDADGTGTGVSITHNNAVSAKALDITSLGTTSAGVVNITANALTTGDALKISSTALTTGNALDITATAAAASGVAVQTNDGALITYTAGAGNANDVYSGLKISATSANHSAATDRTYGLHIADLASADAQGDEYGIAFGTGWDTEIAPAADGTTINIDGDGSPTADILQLGSGDTSATDGVDVLQITSTVSNVSGNAIDITPSFTATSTSKTYNVIDIDAFTASVDDSTGGQIFGTARALNIGALTETVGAADMVSSAAISIGSGWDQTIVGTDGSGSNSGVSVTIAAGSGAMSSGTGAGGSLTLLGGDGGGQVGGGVGASGGLVQITGGDANGSAANSGGDVRISGGNRTSSAAFGMVVVGDASSPPASLNAATAATDARESLFVEGRLEIGGNLVSTSAAAGSTWDVLSLPAKTYTITGGTGITTATGFNVVSIGQSTVTDATPVVITNSATLYVGNEPAAGGSVTITNPYAMWVDAGTSRFDGRVLNTQGADVASATSLTLGSGGNSFEITGTTQIDQILSTGWQEGTIVRLIFNESVTVRHATATSGSNITLLLSGAANLSATANDTLTLMLSSTTAGGQAWREIARTVI